MTKFEDYSTVALYALCTLPLIFLVSLSQKVIYNLFQHPLAGFPGPKLAGASYLYQTYYSLVGGSRYFVKIGKLHEKYGPVVRITPDEIHLNDPENYDSIYFVGSKYAKTPFYDSFGIEYATFVAGPNDVHRIRRATLESSFSRRNVLNLEYIVQGVARKLVDLVNLKFSKNEAVDLHHAFRALSVDVITEYAFGESYLLMEKADLGEHFFNMVTGIGPAMWAFQQWPGLQKFALALPPWITKLTSKPMAQIIDFQEHCREQVIVVKNKMDAGEKLDKPTVFGPILTPREDYVVPSPDQIKHEAYGILAAAADTTGNAMTVATYEVVNNPEMYKALTTELKAAFPNDGEPLLYLTLEKLPYLTGVVKEGLRLSFGIASRLPRIVPEPGVTFNGHFLPAGSYVSMSSWEMHRNETYFPNARKFDPTRWLDPKEAHRLDRAFVPFGKGTRACVGLNLAVCEVYIALGMLFRHFENMKSNVLTEEDRAYNDYFTTHHPIGSTKFHVTKIGE